MTKEKVFHFRILEKTEHFLDEGVVKSDPPRYILYQRVAWILGWKSIYPHYFSTVEAAKERAMDFVDEWKRHQNTLQLVKKHKKELKTTVKIVVDFDINA